MDRDYLKSILKRLVSFTPYAVLNGRQRRGISIAQDLATLLAINPSPTIFDVGANEGQTAKSFSRAFPNARIHSFEPVRSSFDKLTLNAREMPNVQCYRYAVGASSGEVTLHIQSTSELNSLVASLNVETGHGSEPVQMITVEGFCVAAELHHINLLKTDTEGFDLEVLFGAELLLKDQRIDLVLSEIGFRLGDIRHTALSALLSLLEPYGYYLFALYDLPAPRCTPSLEYANALFVRGTLFGADVG